MGALSNIASAATGVTEKAKIYVNQGASALASGSKASAITETRNRLAKVQSKGITASKDTKAFAVQYNPSSLQFFGTAESTQMKEWYNGLTENNMPQQITRPPSITMTLDLIFNKVEPAQAFCSEYLSVGNLIEMGIKNGVIKNVLDNTGVTQSSVKKEINALLACVISPATRYIVFQWGTQRFAGEVQDAKAKYTMFTPNGKPIAGTVHMEIIQTFKEKASLGYWLTAYNNCFNSQDPNKPSGAMKNATTDAMTSALPEGLKNKLSGGVGQSTLNAISKVLRI